MLVSSFVLRSVEMKNLIFYIILRNKDKYVIFKKTGSKTYINCITSFPSLCEALYLVTWEFQISNIENSDSGRL